MKDKLYPIAIKIIKKENDTIKNIDNISAKDIESIFVNYPFELLTKNNKKQEYIKIEINTSQIHEWLTYFKDRYNMLYGNPNKQQRQSENHIAFYVLREANINLTTIAKVFNKNHSTIIYAIEKITGYLQIYNQSWYKKEIQPIKELMIDCFYNTILEKNKEAIKEKEQKLKELLNTIKPYHTILKEKIYNDIVVKAIKDVCPYKN